MSAVLMRIATIHTRGEFRRDLRKNHNKGLIESFQLAAQATDDLIEECTKEAERHCGVKLQDVVRTEGIGDGEILRRIIEWFKSPEGQAFLKFLFSLLLLAIGI